jgi:hypothetical protein
MQATFFDLEQEQEERHAQEPPVVLQGFSLGWLCSPDAVAIQNFHTRMMGKFFRSACLMVQGFLEEQDAFTLESHKNAARPMPMDI